MNKQQLKQRLHKEIDAIEDENALHMLNEAAVEYTRLKDKDILDELSPDQLKELKDSLNQLDKGQWTSHEEVRKLSRAWLQR